MTLKKVRGPLPPRSEDASIMLWSSFSTAVYSGRIM